MTREELAMSLKPIQWVYNREYNAYCSHILPGVNADVYKSDGSAWVLEIMDAMESTIYLACRVSAEACRETARKWLTRQLESLLQLDK